MKTYELSYIISPALKMEEASGLSSEISALIQREGGFFVKETAPSPKTLSYKIKKQGAGFQVNLEFTLEPEKLRLIEEKMKKEERVLRYLLVAKKAPRRAKERKARPILTTAETPSAPAAQVAAPADEDKSKKQKVELKDIEEKLEEILKEQ